ncbi:MAG TPA: GNAT family N-acetyltransferase [Rubrobacteraceae bacterium]|nr:GNAT family N-acetyltransferase [Rubrobacteraceae bacterium]
MPVLETERLVLRPLSAADAAALYRISNDPAVRRYLWDDRPVSRATIEEVVTQSARLFSEEGLGLFGIRLQDSEEVVGFCGFARLAGMEEVEIVYELDPELWGRGLATEAARACLGYAFGEVGLERIIAGTDRPNAASLRLIEKLGMRSIGNVNPRAPEDPYFALNRRDFLRAKEDSSS